MKRKFLSILLTLAMALTLLPVSAMADETPVEGCESTPTVEYVAQIGDKQYATLAEAVAAAKDGETVTLLADVTKLETISITGGKKVDLNLNEKNITFKADNYFLVDNGALNVTGKGNITSSHGNDDNTWLPTIFAYGTSTDTADYSVVTIGKDVVIDNQGSYGLAIWHKDYKAYGAKVIVEGTVKSTYGFTVTGNAKATQGNIPEITVTESGKIVSTDGSAIYAAGYGIYNIAGTLSGTEFGIEIRAGKLNVEDTAKISATGNFSDPVPNGNGSTVTGAAIAVSQHTTNLPIDVNIKGGEISETGTNGHALYEIDTVKDEKAENVAKDVSITVSGGSFNGNVYSTNNKLSITGGTFSSDVSAYVADGYILNNGTVEKLGETNAVAKIGGTYYKTLADAYAAASEDGNAEITLLKSTTISSGMEIRKPVTLNLGGNVLTSEDYGFDVYKNFTLKNGTLNTATWGVWVQNSGVKFTLEAETVINADCNTDRTNAAGVIVDQQASVDIKGKVTAQHDFAVSGNGSAGWGGVTINVMPGAEISTTEDAPALYFPNSTYLTITGGSITGGTGAYVKSGSVTISGGTIIGTGAKAEYKYNGNGANSTGDALVVETCKYPGGAPSVSITGGKFKSVNASAIGSYAGNGETVPLKDFITGGLFSSDPSAYVAAGHYVDASNNGDYPYTVKEGAKPAGALIVVKDKTDTAVSGDITGTDKTAIDNVIGKANVDGVAEAAKKADIVAKSGATVNNNDKVEIEVAVKVEAKAADLANGKLTFEASPVATVKVNGTVKGTVPVSNGMLNNNPITVKLPLPTVGGKLFTPKQILHKFTGGGYEYFINATEGSKRGAGSFKIEDNCAVFTIYGFSTFELSGTVTYVAPSSGGGSSSSSRRYDVSAPSVKHGDVTVSPKTASKGDTVTITVKPDSGYELDTLTVKDASGSKIKVKDKGDGKFTFTMPASKVTVSAEFAEIETLDFADVSTDAYYYEAVKWAAKKGITGGTGDGTFNPNGSCTRAHIVTFLWRAAGSPEPKSTVSFADVPAGSYYAKAVAWAVENGITLGTGDGTFSPNATCTRAQSVTFLYRALGTAPTTVNGFTDVTADAFYADAVAWAVESGVTNGTSDSTFSPNNGCTRAQIVTFLYRTVK